MITGATIKLDAEPLIVTVGPYGAGPSFEGSSPVRAWSGGSRLSKEESGVGEVESGLPGEIGGNTPGASAPLTLTLGIPVAGP